jgi:hypothetical protein
VLSIFSAISCSVKPTDLRTNAAIGTAHSSTIKTAVLPTFLASLITTNTEANFKAFIATDIHAIFTFKPANIKAIVFTDLSAHCKPFSATSFTSYCYSIVSAYFDAFHTNVDSNNRLSNSHAIILVLLFWWYTLSCPR